MAAAKAKGQIRAVVGSDESEVKRAAKALAGEMMPAGGADFGADIIDGAADYADHAVTKVHQTIEALLTFPFFGGEKLVWLKNANFLGDTQTGKAQSVLDALDKLAATLAGGIPASTRFLISATETDKRRTFYKNLQKVAAIEVFDRIDATKAGWEEAAAEIVLGLARTRGLQFEREALELFTLLTGGDRRVIESELEKIDLFLGEKKREVQAENVRLLVPMSRAGVVFELSNAIAERNLPRALALLDQLLFQGEKAVGIMMVAIIPTVRNLLLVKDLMARHKLQAPAQPFYFGKTLDRLPEEALAHMPRKKDGSLNSYPLGVAASHVRRYKMAELRAAIVACLATNVQIVTSGMDAKTALSQLLVKIIAPVGSA